MLEAVRKLHGSVFSGTRTADAWGGNVYRCITVLAAWESAVFCGVVKLPKESFVLEERYMSCTQGHLPFILAIQF